MSSHSASPLLPSLELLAPAKDLDCGIMAIRCGADAVYVGAPRFGAREAASNTVEDIAALASFAHKYWARAYVALNTLLYDHEVPSARDLTWQLYEAGVDGLIIQDMGLLECDLPPLPLIASTQTHNTTPEKVVFLQDVGFSRVILARELSLEEIAAIHRAAPRIQLESFVHGALCVSYSGQCYLSHALGGRSANRGRCAQPCRKRYTLEDPAGNPGERRGHFLSIRDLNLSEHLEALIDAGVTSFKIEGRLKDKAYVANIVAHYRRKLDAVTARTGHRRSSSGTSDIDFTPDPQKTFHRGYTSYFVAGRRELMGAHRTPKMTGPVAARVTRVTEEGVRVKLEPGIVVSPGDGLCYFDREGMLLGARVNQVRGDLLIVDKRQGLEPGLLLHRNHDHRFLEQLKHSRATRRISVILSLVEKPEGSYVLWVRDEDGVEARIPLDGPPEAAKKSEQARETLTRQWLKSGDTHFHCTHVHMSIRQVPFLPLAALNDLRRCILKRLEEAREKSRPMPKGSPAPNDAPYPLRELSFEDNVLNRRAEAFYRRHGVTSWEPAAESGLPMLGRRVMTTRYCLRYEMGRCPRQKKGAPGANAPDDRGHQPLKTASPLVLEDEQGNRLELRFRCGSCHMDVFLISGPAKRRDATV